MPDMFYAIRLHGGPKVPKSHDLLREHEPIHVWPAASVVYFLHQSFSFFRVYAPKECQIERPLVKGLTT